MRGCLGLGGGERKTGFEPAYAAIIYAVAGSIPVFRLKSGKRGSNPRPSAWEADALPTELFPQFLLPVGHWLQRYEF